MNINTLRLLVVVPAAFCAGALLACKLRRRDKPPLCEDCPRYDVADPIGEKYGTEEKK